MGLFNPKPVIDRSPIDKFGVGANADSLMSLANISLNRSQELWDPQSKRNQMFMEQSMENAYNLQGQQNILAQRQAARTGQTNLGGFQSSASIRDSVRKQQMNLMLSQQGQASQLLGQSGQMQGQAGSMRNSLNSMFRQQQAANQKARQDAKNKKYGMMSAVFGAVAGPALGALGGNLAKRLIPTGGGGNPGGGSIFSQAANNIPGGFNFNTAPQQAFANFYGGGNFQASNASPSAGFSNTNYLQSGNVPGLSNSIYPSTSGGGNPLNMLYRNNPMDF